MELISYDPKNFFLAILVLMGGCMTFEPSEPVIMQPTFVESHVIPRPNSFLIEMKEDNTVWHSILGNTKQSPQKVNEPIRKNLGKLIADYKIRSSGLKTSFLVKDDPKSQHTVFRKVIDALKDNDEFKYNLISEDPVSRNSEKNEQEMHLSLPESQVERPNEAQYDNIESKLTLLLLDATSIYGYTGKYVKNGKVYDYKNIRNIIKEASKKYKNKLVVIIKPGKDASYRNTVDILDEMTIYKIKRFAMLKMNAQEKTFIKNVNTKS